MQEIATAASMTTGTVYNHFKTKEEVASAVALLLAHAVPPHHRQPARRRGRRAAYGDRIRRYIWLAEQSPEWARMMLDVSAAAPEMLLELRDYVLADLRLGMKQKAFRVPSRWPPWT
jgi:AcrR family transcriptional regulator